MASIALENGQTKQFWECHWQQRWMLKKVNMRDIPSNAYSRMSYGSKEYFTSKEDFEEFKLRKNPGVWYRRKQDPGRTWTDFVIA